MQHIVCCNPSCISQFVSYTDKLELFNAAKTLESDAVPIKIADWEASQLLSLDWNLSHVLAYGTSSGSVHLVNTQTKEERIVYNSHKLGKRACNAVSWNRRIASQLVGGFENLKNEYCAMIWDFEHEKFLKTSFGESACSLAWLSDNAHTIAIGTSMGAVKAYDTRTTNQQQSVAFSLMAHPAPRPRRVKGVRPDPFHQHIFATFSEFPGDYVKVWDMRKMSSGTAAGNKGATAPLLCTIVPKFAHNNNTTAESIADVAWSPARAGVLAVATSAQLSVSFYSTSSYNSNNNSNSAAVTTPSAPSSNNTAITTSVPLFSIAVPEAIKSLSWQGGGDYVRFTELNHHSYHTDISHLDTSTNGINITNSAELTSFWENFKADDNLNNVNIGNNSVIVDSTPSTLLLFLQGKKGSTRCSDNNNSNCHNKLLPPTIEQSVPFLHLLAGTTTGFVDITVKDRLPLALSTAGLLCTGLQQSVGITKYLCPSSSSSSSTNSNTIYNNGNKSILRVDNEEDISNIMQRRCVAGYSFDAYTNIEVLADELDTTTATTSTGTNSSKNNSLSVYRTWVWLDRFETTCTGGFNSGNISSSNYYNEHGDSNRLLLTPSNCGVLVVMQNETAAVTLSDDNRVAQQQQQLRKKKTVAYFHPSLGSTVFLSDGRLLSKKLCGWMKVFGKLLIATSSHSETTTDVIVSSLTSDQQQQQQHSWVKSSTNNNTGENEEDDDLLEVIVDELFLGSFERAAAIALWHGRLDLAVSVLRRAIGEIQQHQQLEEHANPVSGRCATTPPSEGYLQTLSLVAMCFAGYKHNKASSALRHKGDPVTVWASMCSFVVQQLQQHVGSRHAASYLIAACNYLMANLGIPIMTRSNNDCDSFGVLADSDKASSSSLYLKIIGDDKLAMEDRIAFACTYLPDNELIDWLIATKDDCISRGIIEGVMITGLSAPGGLEILQQYIDIHNDIQTVALLVSRVADVASSSNSNNISSSSSNTTPSSSLLLSSPKECIWLYEYRQLLNRWELFIERAFLDVELGKKYRRKAAASAIATASSSSLTTALGYSGGGSGNADKPSPLTTVGNKIVGGVNQIGGGGGGGGNNNMKGPNAKKILGNNTGGGSSSILSKKIVGGNSSSGGAGTTAAAGMLPISAQQQQLSSAGKGRHGVSSGGATATSSSSSSSSTNRIMYRIPVHNDCPHFYLRCGFCGVALPADGMQNIRPEALRVQKNVMNCCASCSKQLPRCYVCQLYMGMLNPYLELNRVLTQKRINADRAVTATNNSYQHHSSVSAAIDGSVGVDGASSSSSASAILDDGSVCTTSAAASSSGVIGGTGGSNSSGGGRKEGDIEVEHNMMPFGKWFFFCQHCRHGGHANCIDQWFGGSSSSIVGIQKNIRKNTDDEGVEDCRSNHSVDGRRSVCGVNGCNCQCNSRL